MSDAANAIDTSGTVAETSKIPPPPDTGQIGEEELRRRVAQKYEGESPFPEHWRPLLPLVWIGLLFLAIYGIGDWGSLDTWFGENGPQPTATIPWMMYRWNHDQSATHGWLVLPIAIACIYYKRHKLKQMPLVSNPKGLWVMAFALLMHLSEALFDINGPSPLSMPLFLAGAVLYIGGMQWLRALSFPIAYLLFMIPIPGFLNQFISFPLRLLAHNASKAIAGLFGIHIAGAGMSMEFWRHGADPGNTDAANIQNNLVSLIVADPCSGLHSLMAIKALHAITAYMSRLSLPWKWALFWCALPISLAANVCRMTLIILVSYYIDKGFGLKLFHDYSPYLLFLFVFGFLFFIGLVMEVTTGAYKEGDQASGIGDRGPGTGDPNPMPDTRFLTPDPKEATNGE